MPVFDFRFTVSAPLARVREFHSSPEVLSTLTPPPLSVRLHEFGNMQEGMVASFAVGLGPLAMEWKARHEEVSDHGFTDVQVEGPLQRWRHTHSFIPQESDCTLIWEHIEYAYPSGWRGWLSRLMFGKIPLLGLFTYRKWTTKRALERD